MFRSPTPILLVAAFIVIGLVQGYGQEKKEVAKVNFTCLLWKSPLHEKIYFRDGKNYTPIEVFTGSRSLTHTLAKSQKFQLFVRRDVGEEVVYHLVGNAKILPGVRQMLYILFVRNSKDGLNIRILPMDDSLKGFPAGTIRFANFSKSDLQVKLADKTKKIRSSEMTVMETKAGKNGGLFPVFIRNNQGKRIFETRLFAQKNGREIVFIGEPESPGGLPSVRFLPQLLPQKLPKPPATP